MSTFIGHALAGTLATRIGSTADVPRRGALAAVAVVTAILPDLDIVVYLTLGPLGMTPHRGFSHSILFALASASIITLVGSRFLRVPTARLWCALAVAALSHPVLDYLMGAGPAVPLFAPLSDRGYLFPYRLLPIAFYGKAAEAYLAPSFWMLNALAAALECLIFLPALAVASRPRPGRAAWLAAAVTACGFLVTLTLYNR